MAPVAILPGLAHAKKGDIRRGDALAPSSGKIFNPARPTSAHHHPAPPYVLPHHASKKHAQGNVRESTLRSARARMVSVEVEN